MKACWVLGLGMFALSASAQSPPRLPTDDVGIEQRLDKQVPLELVFRDESGQPVALQEFFDDKPVILVLAYFRCPRLCSLVLNGLLDSLKEITLASSTDFQIVVVSFDPRDTAELAAAKKQAYLEQYGRPGAGRGWHFLTGDKEAIARLAEAVGFRFAYDSETGDYRHASGIMVLTPTGRISRYFYGMEFPPRDVRLALVEASRNRIGSPVDQVLLFCLSYDPVTGKYRMTAMTLMRVGGVLTALAILGVLLLTWRREHRKARRRAAATDD